MSSESGPTYVSNLLDEVWNADWPDELLQSSKESLDALGIRTKEDLDALSKTKLRLLPLPAVVTDALTAASKKKGIAKMMSKVKGLKSDFRSRATSFTSGFSKSLRGSFGSSMSSETDLRKVFDSIDTDGSGTIDRFELAFALGRMNKSKAEVQAIVEELGDDEIDFAAFKALFGAADGSAAQSPAPRAAFAMASTPERIVRGAPMGGPPGRSAEAFVAEPDKQMGPAAAAMVGGVDIERMKRLFHQYPNASLSADEFCAVMSQVVSTPTPKLLDLFKKMDVDNSNSVEWQEFVDYMTGGSKPSKPDAKHRPAAEPPHVPAGAAVSPAAKAVAPAVSVRGKIAEHKAAKASAAPGFDMAKMERIFKSGEFVGNALSMKDFLQVFGKEMPVCREALAVMFHFMDTDGSNTIEWEEFVSFCKKPPEGFVAQFDQLAKRPFKPELKAVVGFDKEVMEALFECYPNKQVHLDDFVRIVSRFVDHPRKKLELLFKKIDTDKSGTVEWSEFLEFLRSTQKKKPAASPSGPAAELDED